ncbi:MAG: hypothetical protein EHM41_04960 [Chloroflexi bacterium]|nr:MAG: hypothetical protein EHM41_04960 [Chloroflexota bacterium]
MDILGIGPLELVFIFLIALIILGPQEMARVGKIAGRFLRKIMISPTWKEIRNLPYRIIREAGIDEIQEELKGPAKKAPRRDSVVLPTPASKSEASSKVSEASSNASGASSNASGASSNVSEASSRVSGASTQSPRNIGVQDSVATEWITPAAAAEAAPDAWTTPPSDEKMESPEEEKIQSKGLEDS